MFRPTHRRAASPPPRRSARPAIEGLEDRFLLYAATGAQWVHPERITYSFAPDGTDIGGVPSNLNARMAQRGISTQSWQDQFRRAAATWEQFAGVNLVEVSDDGSPYGTPGNQQGDPRFGDIRIGGSPMGGGGLAGTWSPPPFNGGTLAGDMVFNTSSNIAWNVNNTYDILTVAIHEFGHALGLAHSDGSTLVGMGPEYYSYPDMYSSYTGYKQSLTSDDTAGIQSIYGARQPDAFDAVGNNQTLPAANNLTSYLDANGRATITGLDISHYTDADAYFVIVPASTTGTLTVTMQSSNLSSLSPRLQLFNGSGVGIEQPAAPGTFGATVSITYSPVVPGQKYYIRAMAASAVPTGAGAYGLQINFGGGTMNPIAPPNTAVAEQLDQSGLWADESIGEPGNGHGHGYGHSKDRSGPGHHEMVSIGSLQALGDTLEIGSLTRSPALVEGGGLMAFTPVGFPGSAGPAAGLIAFTLDTAPGLSSLSGPDRPDRNTSTQVLDHVLQNLGL